MPQNSKDELLSDDLKTNQFTSLFTSKQSPETLSSDREYHPFRKLLVFQLKLALDALRDILLSPISVIAIIIDVSQGRKGDNGYFEMLMKLGRNSDARINLFDQHQGEKQTVDNLFNQVEDVLKRQYEKGGSATTSSEKAKQKIESELYKK